MKNNVVRVTLWNKEVGQLYWDAPKGNSVFQFNEEFLTSGLDIAPVTAPLSSPTVQRGFPLYGNKAKPYLGLPEFISDSMPDHWGNKVFQRWMESQHLKNKQITPVDRLSFIGKRAMGALEYYPAYIQEDSGVNLQLESLYDFARTLFAERQEVRLNASDGFLLEDLYKVGSSAGGQRPKIIIGMDETTGEVRSGQAVLPPSFKHFILKFDMGKDGDFPLSKVEMAYYLMASDAGIEMMPSRLVEIEGRKHFLTQRFDREDGQKIHTQTLAAMSSQADSYEDLFLVGRKIHLTANEQEQQFRRMVFNVLGANVDDHTKNFSFMMRPDGEWKLTPAYDMVFSVDTDTVFFRNHSMTIMGKAKDIIRQDLLDFAAKQDIKNAVGIIDNVAEVIGKFQDYAQTVGINGYWTERITQVLKENDMMEKVWKKIVPVTETKRHLCENGIEATDIRIVKLRDGGYRLYADIGGETYQYNFSKKSEITAKINLGELCLTERNELIERYLVPKAMKAKEQGKTKGLKL